MLTAKLLELIETHADTLAREVLKDFSTNSRMPSFQKIARNDLEARIAATYRNLGTWIQSSGDEAVRGEYEVWGRKRFREGVLISELVYAIILIKQHLRRFIRNRGAEDFSGDPRAADLIGVQLHEVQELNYRIGEFFDRALYYLVRGYEAEALASENVSPTG